MPPAAADGAVDSGSRRPGVHGFRPALTFGVVYLAVPMAIEIVLLLAVKLRLPEELGANH